MEHHSGDGDGTAPPDVRLITIHKSVPPIEVTMVVNASGIDEQGYKTVDEWVEKIRAKYYEEGSEENVVIGMVADAGLCSKYQNGEVFFSLPIKNNHGSYLLDQDATPYRLLQFCVGRRHVLFLYFKDFGEGVFPKSLAALLTDTRTVVGCVHTPLLVKKLEKDFGFNLKEKPVQLVDLMELFGDYKSWTMGDTNMIDFASWVFRDPQKFPFNVDEVWEQLGGKNMRWWKSLEAEPLELSEEKVATGTLKAYLIYRIAMRLKASTRQHTDPYAYNRWWLRFQKANQKSGEGSSQG